MVSSQEQLPNNRKTIAPWKLTHPDSLHTQAQPHVNLLNLIQYHLNTPSRFKKYFQCIDLLIFRTFLFLYSLPIPIRNLFKKQNNITLAQFNCLLLSAYYAKQFTGQK